MSLYPWDSVQEWNDVFELLYSSETARKRKGLARVLAWKARGVVPALLEVTADLVSCSVHEDECAQTPDFCGQVLQLMYAMALTRFVNGAFDVHYVIGPFHNRDIKTVLGHLGVPAYIVTLRHQCAHRSLPSLESLKCAADTGLQWLLDNYWEPQRLRNHRHEDKCVSKEVEDSIVFIREQKNKKPVKQAKSLLSNCTAVELSHHLLYSQFLGIAGHKVILPVDSDKEQGLPQLQVEGLSWSLWWHTVREVAQSRPGLETIVVSAFIIATHDLQCTVERKHFLAGWLGQSLIASKKGPWLNTDAVDWLEVFAVIQQNPGYYSEAFMNIVLPCVSKHLPNEVIVQSEQLAKLITQSERYSQFAYNRPLNAALREELSAEVARISHARDDRGGDGNDCIILEEAPPRKRPRLDTSSKWKITKDHEEWAGHELGLCPGQETSDLLDLKFHHSLSQQPHQQTTSFTTGGACGLQTFTRREVTRIQTDIHKKLNTILL